MSSPATAARAHIKSVIATVYSAEGWTAGDDKIGRSMGKEVAVDEATIAVTTDYERERLGQAIMLDIGILVQFYLGFDASPDETITRDVTDVEEYADRLRNAFSGSGATVDDGDAWYLRVVGTEYPDDPTGNKTRFEMNIVCEATNAAALPNP
jgi:hypothetical protein